jgi:glucose/arabinose dehydrogenase
MYLFAQCDKGDRVGRRGRLSGVGDRAGELFMERHEQSNVHDTPILRGAHPMNHLLSIRHLLTAAAMGLSMAAAAIDLVPVVSGLQSPTFVGNAGDATNRLFIIEQRGVIKVLQPGSSVPTVFLDISSKVLDGGERGLLGLAFHPGYRTNGLFFVYYTREPEGDIVIARYQVSANPNVAGTAETVLLTIPHAAFSNHNGGMLAFGRDGLLYAGVGDGGSGNDPSNNAQNVNVLLGKILRIDVDNPAGGLNYSSPPDNPYAGATPGRDEIYSIGWRNPWRFSFDRITGQQWVADVGQGAREEVDTPVVKGGNYGWRVFEGSNCTGIDPTPCNSPANYIFPIFDYGHTNGRCSITGGYVYRGVIDTLPAGSYVYGDYCSGEIFVWNGVTQQLLLDTQLNISSFGEDEQGELYVVNLGGSVSKIVLPGTPPITLDVDASGPPTRYDGLTDGLIILRYLFGFREAALTRTATGPSAARTDTGAVTQYLDRIRRSLDVDDNGTEDALTDGLLIIRYLLGIRDEALTANALGPLPRGRSSPTDIANYIQSLMP